MAFHDKLAYLALQKGHSAATFHASAQRHANRTWFFAVMAVGTWLLIGWSWALIPAALALFSVTRSISATMVAIRLEKFPSPAL